VTRAFLEELALAPDDVVPFSLAGRPTFLLKHPDFRIGPRDRPAQIRQGTDCNATRLLGHGLLTAEGGSHRRQRRSCSPLFIGSGSTTTRTRW
jgi:cytochrome P450